MKVATHRIKFLEGKSLLIQQLANQYRSPPSPGTTEKDSVSFTEDFESTPPLFTSSPPNVQQETSTSAPPRLPKMIKSPHLSQHLSRQTSNGSQFSTSSTQPFAFEVMKIQMRKTVSGSSDSSSSQ